MDAVTYPTPEVVDLLNRHFVCFTVNTKEPGHEGRELLRAHRLLWEPGFVFLDHSGAELRRFVGFRPPRHFTAELHLVLGLVDLLYNRATEAAQRFAESMRHADGAEPGPEALYWSGIAIYRREGRSLGALAEVWNDLRARYPGSGWWDRADVLAHKPTGVRRPS